MNKIEEYVNRLTPAEFEELCAEYIRWIYRDKKITVHGTRLNKDGGKDIEASAVEVPYQIWAEVKKHQRNVGLEDIAKNVILVISKGIRELLFFSVSNITRTAIKHISIVSVKHDFSVSFYYGQYLFDVLGQLPRFSQEVKPNTLFLPKDLEVTRFFSTFEEPDFYTKTSHLLLQRDNHFFIDLYFTNHCITEVSNIVCMLPQMTNVQFSIMEIDKNIFLPTKGNRLIQIRAEVLNCYNRISIPPITIKYNVDNCNKSIKVIGGLVDPTKLIYYPLVGQTIHKFLAEKVSPILHEKNFSNQFLLDIRGNSGTGKSRLIKECISIAQQSGWQSIYLDAKQIDSFVILKEILCACIGIPFHKGILSCALDEMQLVIAKYGGSSELSNSIYLFIFEDNTDKQTLYYIQEALIFFTREPVGNTYLLISIDNMQCVNEDTLHILHTILFKHTSTLCKTLFALGTNTEIVPAGQVKALNTFLEKLDLFADSIRLAYMCNEMTEEDTKVLYLHALDDLQYHESLVKLLIQKSGKRPFDIIMTIHSFHDANVVMQSADSHWKIQNIDLFYEQAERIPSKSDKLIDLRFKMQKEHSFSSVYNPNYYEAFKLAIKATLYFKGFVPVAFLISLGIDEEMQYEINQSFFLKYDSCYPCILFFHDNIHRFFSKNQMLQNDRNLSLIIIKWLEENEWYRPNTYSIIIFECAQRACEFEKALQFGLDSIKEETNHRNYDAVVSIGTAILENTVFSLSAEQKFQILYALADAYRIHTDLSKSALYFEQAYKILNNYSSIQITDIEQCRFFHSYANAFLSVCDYAHMLEVLCIFEKKCLRTHFYDFILYDRYSVAYLALNEIDLSLEYINRAIEIADANKKGGWKSTAFSDKAYIFYRALENKKETVNYFKKAVEYYDSKEASISRSAEILVQEAFVYTLEENYVDAEIMAAKALAQSQNIHSISMEIKSRNLCGIVACFQGKHLEAIRLWHENLAVCSRHSSTEGTVKALSNLGSLYMIKGDKETALDYCQRAYKKYLKNNMALVSHKPLVYNLVKLYHSLGQPAKRDSLVADQSFDNLSQFYNEIMFNEKLLNCYWPLEQQDCFFNY